MNLVLKPQVYFLQWIKPEWGLVYLKQLFPFLDLGDQLPRCPRHRRKILLSIHAMVANLPNWSLTMCSFISAYSKQSKVEFLVPINSICTVAGFAYDQKCPLLPYCLTLSQTWIKRGKAAETWPHLMISQQECFPFWSYKYSIFFWQQVTETGRKFCH